MTVESAAAHRSSHSALVPSTSGPGLGSIDAIVVPAARPADRLLPAMEVAARLGHHFVALCSGRTQVAETAGLAAEVPGLSWTATEFHVTAELAGLLEFGTSEVPEAVESRVGDLSAKRNTGLLLAHQLGWQGLLFLDDDISDLSPAKVGRAAGMLRRGRMAGLTSTAFPDNSVVCHAARLAGDPQGVFVSGSALAVDTRWIDSFFPEIYNEDWFFLFDHVRHRQVSVAGEVRQAAYEPFADPARARGEEFGDLLAEGLMSMLHDGLAVKTALTPQYWRQAITQRRDLLVGILKKLADSPLDVSAAMTAVEAAQDKLAGFDAAVLARWTRTWRRDLRVWRARLDRVPRVDSVPAALRRLGLRPVTAANYSGVPVQDDGEARLPAAPAVGERLPFAGGDEPELVVEGARGRVVLQHP